MFKFSTLYNLLKLIHENLSFSRKKSYIFVLRYQKKDVFLLRQTN